MNKIIKGNCLTELKKLDDNSVNCCVTSPPYWGLRDYDNKDQLGLEKTPEEYVGKLVEIFNEVKRVLKDDGTLWLNLGDSYMGASSEHKDEGSFGKHSCISKGTQSGVPTNGRAERNKNLKMAGYKPKDLVGIPWMVAFALRADGWYLRQDIIWHKPNPMPESVTDRCTKSHEYIFLMSKSAKYYYDNESIKTEIKQPDIKNTTFGSMSGTGKKGLQYSGNKYIVPELANKRSVWTVTTKQLKESHFATFPQELIVDCIKAGCPEGGIVLDPFSGAGTTPVVARKLNRNYLAIELNGSYIKIANERLNKELGIFI